MSAQLLRLPYRFPTLGRMAHDPTKRGYHVVYRRNEVNRCPGCGRSNWYVGRLSAECAFCSTAIPIGGEG